MNPIGVKHSAKVLRLGTVHVQATYSSSTDVGLPNNLREVRSPVEMGIPVVRSRIEKWHRQSRLGILITGSIPLEGIAVNTAQRDIDGKIYPTLGDWMDMIERKIVRREVI